MAHDLKLIPQQQQHVRIGSLIMGMWCDDCKRWYYRGKDGNWPTKCPQSMAVLTVTSVADDAVLAGDVLPTTKLDIDVGDQVGGGWYSI